MSLTFRQLIPEDNEGAIKLLEVCGNADNDFSIRRNPDFFSLGEQLGEATFYGVFDNEVMVGCIGITKQIRNIKGVAEPSFYLHDLRVHPYYRGTSVFKLLITGVVDIYEKLPECKCMHSVILKANNKHLKTLTEGRSLFPGGKSIAIITHIGFPLFIGKPFSTATIISVDEAWEFYKRTALLSDFSLSDENLFKAKNGFFLGIRKNGKLMSSCKIIDQQFARKIVVNRKLTRIETIINLYCRLRGKTGYPGKGEVFRHCYLSYLCGEDLKENRSQYIAYLRNYFSKTYCYVFTGLSNDDANGYKNPLLIKFQSEVYGYGDIPSLNFNFYELSLI